MKLHILPTDPVAKALLQKNGLIDALLAAATRKERPFGEFQIGQLLQCRRELESGKAGLNTLDMIFDFARENQQFTDNIYIPEKEAEK